MSPEATHRSRQKREMVRGQSINGNHLRLDVSKPDESTIEISVTNEDFSNSCIRCFKHILGLCLIYGLFNWATRFQWIVLDVVLWFILYFLVNRLAAIIYTETIVLVNPLALQMTTVYAFSRTSRSLIPISNIHDIVINEVIVDFEVIYVLNILTKGESFNQRPVIPLLLTRPRVSILETVYRDLQTVLRR